MLPSIFPTAEDFPLSPPPSWSQPFVTAISIFSILLPAGPIRLSSGGILFGFLFYLFFWTRDATIDAYLCATTCITVLFRWLDLVAIHRPEADFWRVTGKDEADSKIKGRAPKRWKEKLYWFSGLWSTIRGLGWNIQVSSIPEALPADYPKWTFIRETAFKAIRYYLELDIAQAVVQRLPSGPFYSLPFTLQVLLGWLAGFKAHHGLEVVYALCALSSVTMGLHRPRDWPSISGSFRNDAWSVRRMWGKCWHQSVRRQSTESGRIVKELFGFKKGGLASRYSQIWIAFAVSAVMHHTGAVIGMFEDGGYNQAVYFMVQPLGFMAEDFVMYLGRLAGIRESVWTKRVGVVWVFLWFSWWLRYMIAYQPRSWVDNSALPSLVNYTLKRKAEWQGIKAI